jgi:ABC-type dipeptide/oligopeptide/nickel transport system permease subunit
MWAVYQWLIWVAAMLFGAFVGMSWGFARGYTHGWRHAKRATMELFTGGAHEKTRR